MKCKLREVVEKKGKTLYWLANQMGVNTTTVYSWANCTHQPQYENMDKLCHYLDCSMGELFEAEPVQTKLLH